MISHEQYDALVYAHTHLRMPNSLDLSETIEAWLLKPETTPESVLAERAAYLLTKTNPATYDEWRWVPF